MTTAALLLASAMYATAQTKPAEGTSGTPTGAVTGTVDVGFRATTVDGDEARYERYRDLRNGLYTNIFFGKETDTYLYDVAAKNVGYNDQTYGFNYQNSRMRFSFLWDSIPLNYCYNCLTPWRESGANSWVLDDAVQSQVQKSRYPSPVTPLPAGYVAIPLNYVQSQLVSVYRAQAQTFEMQSRRDVAGVKFGYDMTPDVALNVDFTTTKKSGYQPFGMSHAFSNANELPMQLDNRTNDFGAAVEWVKPKGMFRAALEHSMFSNTYNEVLWDNPLNLTDYNNGRVPPDGPYDPSGYSNGNGAARGRISSFPDNSMTVVSFMGLYKFTRSTTVNGTVQISDQSNDDDLIPWTTNSQINQPSVWALFPHLAELPRPTAEAKVRGVNALINFNSRPTRRIGLNMKYRHNTHASVSRPFPYDENVRFDAVPEETPGEFAEGHSIIRDTFDASVSFNPMAFSTLRVGYLYDNYDRTGRTHNDMRDQGLRLTWDTVGAPWLSLRVGYEYIDRTGYGFSEQAVEDAAAQPGLRFYDEADRERNRLNALVTLTPFQTMDFTASVAYTDDHYGGPGMEFGLFDVTSTAYNFGVNYTPSDHLAMGFNYGRDDFSTYQKARNANPPPDPSWTDPNRDWWLDNDEKVNNFDVYVDVLNAIRNTGIRFSYNYSDSDNALVLGGPRTVTLYNTIDVNGFRTFEQLPKVTNDWQQFMVDLKYTFSSKVGFAVAYMYEKLGIDDFATINLPGTSGYGAQPRIDYLGGLTTGYANRPYKGSTFTARLLYTF
jgi:hypothetical protein